MGYGLQHGINYKYLNEMPWAMAFSPEVQRQFLHMMLVWL